MTEFSPGCLPVLIGSLPLTDHGQAMEWVFAATPDIPLWVQLPALPGEGMIAQFQGGMPGLRHGEIRDFVDTSDEGFDAAVLSFYEEYMAVADQSVPPEEHRFVMTRETAPGLYALLEALANHPNRPKAIKGQITGPITFTTGLTDQDGRAIFYDDQLRDAAVKLLSLKAAWQAKKLSAFGPPVIVFLDEPALAGFGSSEFISITRQDIVQCLDEAIAAIHSAGAMAGIHVCANTDWSILLDSGLDIINFDAYGYFDKFVLYSDPIRRFIQKGGILAWGWVPTLNPDDVKKESAESLFARLREAVAQMESLGIDWPVLKRQSLISPACGTGSLPIDLAQKVLRTTAALSRKAREWER